MQQISSVIAAGGTLLALALPVGAQAATDRNHDRIPDRWERTHHLSLRLNQAKRDQDHDGLVNRSEYLDHTDPHRRDSDQDGVPDGREDADHDGVTNVAEQEHHESGATPDGAPHAEPGASVVSPPPPAPPATAAPAAPALPAPPASTGVVSAVGDGSTTITRPSGEVVPGLVRSSTVLRCIRVADGHAVSNEPCSSSHLVVGAQVATAQRALVDGAWAWTAITLIEPST
jgi:hypothetical protein